MELLIIEFQIGEVNDSNGKSVLEMSANQFLFISATPFMLTPLSRHLIRIRCLMLNIAPLKGLFLLLDVEAVFHNELPRLQLLIPLDLPHHVHIVPAGCGVLGGYIKVDFYLTSILGLESESID